MAGDTPRAFDDFRVAKVVDELVFRDFGDIHQVIADDSPRVQVNVHDAPFLDIGWARVPPLEDSTYGTIRHLRVG